MSTVNEIIQDFMKEFDVANRDGNTPLLLAIKKRNKPKIIRLIEIGADVNATNVHGTTPLMMAIEHIPSIDIIKMLINHGADINAKRRGDSIVNFALHCFNYKVARLLVDYGAYATEEEMRMINDWLNFKLEKSKSKYETRKIFNREKLPKEVQKKIEKYINRFSNKRRRK